MMKAIKTEIAEMLDQVLMLSSTLPIPGYQQFPVIQRHLVRLLCIGCDLQNVVLVS